MSLKTLPSARNTMLIHSLIAVRWDEQEGLFYPIGSEHYVKPFLTNGVIAFAKRFHLDCHSYPSVITAKTEIDSNNLPTNVALTGIIDRVYIHGVIEYLESQLARYCEQDLPFDRAKESC